MNAVLNQLSPSITNLIRADHTKVLAVFHRYKADSSPAMKQALAAAVCVSVDIHAQLEEELFYPALRAADPHIVEKNVGEHDEMRRLISDLRAMEPTDNRYDETFMALMRQVIHHVADEETILLPHAEKLIPDRLGSLGAAMMKRKMELMMPRAKEIAMNKARGTQTGTLVAFAGALLAGGLLLRQTIKRD